MTLVVDIPAVVMGELRNGLSVLDEGRRKRELEQWLSDCHRLYVRKIVAFDLRVADVWGNLKGMLEKRGRMPPVIDSQIAATAIACDMVLVTRNVKDMAGTGVRMLNPFSQN